MTDKTGTGARTTPDGRLIIEKGGYTPLTPGPRVPPATRSDLDLLKAYRPSSEGPKAPPVTKPAENKK